MIDLVETLRVVERHLSEAHGPFDLFALFRRRRGVDWELVASAPWFDPGRRATIELFIDELRKAGGTDLLSRLARITITPDGGFLESVRSVATVEHGMVPVGPGEYGNIEISRGYVITCRPAVVPA